MEAGQSVATELDYRALFQAVPGLYLVLRTDFKIVAVSDAYLAATMTRRDEIIGRGLFEVFPDNPDDPNATGVNNLRASLERVLSNRAADTMAVQKYDVRRPASEGGGFAERYWSPVNSPVLDAAGNVSLIIHRVEDVSEFVRLKIQDRRKEAETRELRGQAERMEAEIYRRAQELQQSNKALRESEERLQQLNATLEERIQERGRQLEAEARERARTQEALRERQKVEAIGRLTGSIAHDFNNLLTVVLGNADLLREHLAGGPAAPMVNAIERASERGARLVRQLLAFSRRQALRPETIDIAGHIRSLDDFLTGSLGGDIKLVMALPEDLWPVECDVGEFELALINLCVNARDAMPGGGLLRIAGRNVMLARGDLAGGDLEGPFVAISVSDTGTGIEPDVLKRVFEPLFTTKEIGKGSGLGLTQVHGFATQSGGVATIESEIGHGTSVTLHLPRSRSATRAEEQPRAAAAPRGSGEVLLVEDDEGVAKIAAQLLDMIGYRVQWVQDAQTALALLIGGRSFDLLFSDIVMPGGMSGLDLARRVRRHFPELPILLASGFSTTAAEVAREGFAIIAKPYRADALAGAIEQALHDSRAHAQRSA
jgi:signal transduction histidine kinase/CheY-like chemotaxis protein